MNSVVAADGVAPPDEYNAHMRNRLIKYTVARSLLGVELLENKGRARWPPLYAVA